MLRRFHRFRARQLLRQGWKPKELIDRKWINLPYTEVAQIGREENEVLLQEKHEEIELSFLEEQEKDQAPSQDPHSVQELPKRELHLPDYIERGGFYDEEAVAHLEALAKEYGISYTFFKERYLVGDGCCWICGGKLKSETHFFCPWHNTDMKEALRSYLTEEKKYPESSYANPMTLKRIAQWSLDHEDFQLPQRFLCPKCEDRPHAPDHYLCEDCQGYR